MNNKEIVENLVFVDYNPIAFDKKVKKFNKGKVCRGDFRLTNGNWRTDREKEKFNKKAWETNL